MSFKFHLFLFSFHCKRLPSAKENRIFPNTPMLYNFYTLHCRMEKIPAMQTFRIRRVLRARFIFHRTFVFVVSPAAHTISPYPARLKIYVADRPQVSLYICRRSCGHNLHQNKTVFLQMVLISLSFAGMPKVC